jgi:hypothetical protein
MFHQLPPPKKTVVHSEGADQAVVSGRKEVVVVVPAAVFAVGILNGSKNTAIV